MGIKEIKWTSRKKQGSYVTALGIYRLWFLFFFSIFKLMNIFNYVICPELFLCIYNCKYGIDVLITIFYFLTAFLLLKVFILIQV